MRRNSREKQKNDSNGLEVLVFLSRTKSHTFRIQDAQKTMTAIIKGLGYQMRGESLDDFVGLGAAAAGGERRTMNEGSGDFLPSGRENHVNKKEKTSVRKSESDAGDCCRQTEASLSSCSLFRPPSTGIQQTSASQFPLLIRPHSSARQLNGRCV